MDVEKLLILCDYILNSDSKDDKIQSIAEEFKLKYKKEPLFIKGSEILVKFNQYTVYTSIIHDIRNRIENGVFVYEYLIDINIYDCPTKNWIAEDKIIKTIENNI